MVDTGKKEKFVELRASGLSFDKIASQTGISKPTLIKMNRELAVEVNRLRLINIEALAQKYGLLRESRIEALANLLARVDTAIVNADLNTLAPDKLVDMRHKLTDRLKAELNFTHTEPSDNETRLEGFFDYDIGID